MKILVNNAGSASIKYQLFDMAEETVPVSGMAEKFGSDACTLSRIVTAAQGIQKNIDITEKLKIARQKQKNIVE